MTFRQMLEELDTSFLRNAEKCTSFNFPKGTFEKLDNKEEVRHLINKHWLFDIEPVNFTNMNEGNLKEGVKLLKNSKNFLHLYTYTPKGIGPGEVMTYYLFDDVKLGGGKSAGVDVICSAGEFEIKDVVPENDSSIYGKGKFVKNFKLGGTKDLAPLITKLRKLKQKAIDDGKITGKSAKAKEVGRNHYKVFVEYYTQEWNKILNEYQTIAYNYFKDENVIFFANKNSAGYKTGDVVYFGSINKDNIFMDNQTAGTIKPIIMISK